MKWKSRFGVFEDYPSKVNALPLDGFRWFAPLAFFSISNFPVLTLIFSIFSARVNFSVPLTINDLHEI